MLLIPFLVAYSKPSNELVVSKKVDDESMFWVPVIAGIISKKEAEHATLVVSKKVDDESMFWVPVIAGIISKKEAEHATMEELQIYNEVAKRKLDLMGGADLSGE